MKNNNVKNVNNNVTNVKDVNVSINHENSVNDQTVNSVRSDEKVSNVLPVESDEKINKKWDTNTIQFLVSNVNGIKSKYQSLSNICNQNGIRVMLLSETHTAGGIEPFVDKNFKAFYNNRNKKKYSTCKGGVAILYERGSPLVRSDKYFVSFSTCNPTTCSHWLTQSQNEADIYYLFIIG